MKKSVKNYLHNKKRKGEIKMEKQINFEKIAQISKEKGKLESFRESLDKSRMELFQTEEKKATIESILSRYTSDEIESMDYETILKTFVDSDGEPLFQTGLTKEFVVDLIRYLKLSDETFKKIDDEFVGYEEAMETFNKEIDDLVKEMGSFNKTFMHTLSEQLDDETITQERRTNVVEMIKGIGDASTLEPLFQLYEKIGTDNTLKELKTDFKRMDVLKSYVKVCQTAKITPNLMKMGLLENKLFGEAHTYDKNLFVFIVARYIKYLGKEKVNNPRNRMFIIQLTSFMREFYLPEDNQQVVSDRIELDLLKSNIEKLLKSFY